MALLANEWATRIAQQVGRQIKHYRETAPGPEGRTGMTAQRLADRCTELGLKMDRAVIAKLEKGMRQTVTVGEILVMARALNVEPILLIMPLGTEAETEVLPGQKVDTWSALKWFGGDTPQFPGESAEAGGGRAPSPIRQFCAHDELLEEYREHRRQALDYIAQRTAMDQARAVDAERAKDAMTLVDVVGGAAVKSWKELQALRQTMTDQGMTPPVLTPEDASIETEVKAALLRYGTGRP